MVKTRNLPKGSDISFELTFRSVISFQFTLVNSCSQSQINLNRLVRRFAFRFHLFPLRLSSKIALVEMLTEAGSTGRCC